MPRREQFHVFKTSTRRAVVRAFHLLMPSDLALTHTKTCHRAFEGGALPASRAKPDMHTSPMKRMLLEQAFAQGHDLVAADNLGGIKMGRFPPRRERLRHSGGSRAPPASRRQFTVAVCVDKIGLVGSCPILPNTHAVTLQACRQPPEEGNCSAMNMLLAQPPPSWPTDASSLLTPKVSAGGPSWSTPSAACQATVAAERGNPISCPETVCYSSRNPPAGSNAFILGVEEGLECQQAGSLKGLQGVQPDVQKYLSSVRRCATPAQKSVHALLVNTMAWTPIEGVPERYEQLNRGHEDQEEQPCKGACFTPVEGAPETTFIVVHDCIPFSVTHPSPKPLPTPIEGVPEMHFVWKCDTGGAANVSVNIAGTVASKCSHGHSQVPSNVPRQLHEDFSFHTSGTPCACELEQQLGTEQTAPPGGSPGQSPCSPTTPFCIQTSLHEGKVQSSSCSLQGSDAKLASGHVARFNGVTLVPGGAESNRRPGQGPLEAGPHGDVQPLLQSPWPLQPVWPAGPRTQGAAAPEAIDCAAAVSAGLPSGLTDDSIATSCGPDGSSTTSAENIPELSAQHMLHGNDEVQQANVPPKGRLRASSRGAVPAMSNQREAARFSRRKSLAGVGLVLDVEDGKRRSTRNRLHPLQYWRNEHMVYSRDESTTLPTQVKVITRTPDPEWPLPSGKAGQKKRRRLQPIDAEDAISQE